MYDQYYGFSRKPFSISPDPDFLYLNPAYREAFSMLQYGIEERRGIICLIGEVGTGKTMLLNKLLQSLKKQVRIPAVSFPITSFKVLVTDMVGQLDVPAQGKPLNEQLATLRRYLFKESRKDHIVAIIIDEAQTLSVQAMEALRLLSNIETPKEKLIQIVLSGQPELKEKLNLVELRQFKQRIATSFQLCSLSRHEVPLYIAHRMNVAGNTRGLGLFSEQALSFVSDYSSGIPRLINALCENSLLIGYALGKPLIDGQMVREAARDLMLVKEAPIPELSTLADPLREGEQKNRAGKPQPRPVRHGKSTFKPVLKWAGAAAIAVSMVTVFSSPEFLKRNAKMVDQADRVFHQVLSRAKATLGLASPNFQTPGQAEQPIPGPVVARILEERVPSSESGGPPPAAPTLHGAPSLGVQARDSLERFTLHKRKDATERVQEPAEQPLRAIQDLKTDIPGSADEHGRPPGDGAPAAPLIPASMVVTQEHPAIYPKNALPDTFDSYKRTHTVQTGETVSHIALEIYGFLNSFVYALVHFSNPDINDLDFVRKGQVISFPPLNPESLVFKNGNGRFFILVSASRELIQARRWKALLGRDGEYGAEIIRIRMTSTESIHCVLITGFQTRGEAVSRLAELSKQPSTTQIMEESREQNL